MASDAGEDRRDFAQLRRIEFAVDAELHALQALILQQQTAFLDGMVGQTVDVLFERAGRHAGQIAGKSPYLSAVAVAGDASLIGKIAPVRIARVTANSLVGDLLAVEAA